LKRRQYSNEFKTEAVKLSERGDVAVRQIAEDLGIGSELLRRWIRQFGTKPKTNGSKNITPEDHSELIRLRRELRRITEERDILKKVMGIFTRELP